MGEGMGVVVEIILRVGGYKMTVLGREEIRLRKDFIGKVDAAC